MFSEATSAKGGINVIDVADYMESLRYKTHIYAGMFYIEAGVFVLRWIMKCSTAFIGGYRRCIIVEIHSAIALI